MLSLHYTGKSVLVFGELKSAVRFSNEQYNSCPNYWHFSPYGFCPYGCRYCYLAGTQGVKFSPTVKIYVNLPEMLQKIDRIALHNNKIVPFYLGKLQDPLALDPLTNYSSVYIHFFAKHPFARLILLTKSTNVENIVNLDHHGNTILSWSVNPPEICKIFEENVPSIEERLEAMKLAVSAGYTVRAVMMPIIPVDNWQKVYSNFIKLLLEKIYIQRLTLGGICIYSGAQKLMEQKMGTTNPISTNIYGEKHLKDGRAR
jgi:spore photoproduct lyase